MTRVGNFEISVELKDLKIHVKGHRDLAPEIASNVAQQISEVFQPAGLIEGPSERRNDGHLIQPPPLAVRRARKRSAGRVMVSPNAPAALTWNHDPEKWGSPSQNWKQWQKIMWLLTVTEQEVARKDLTPAEMADVFNTKFREAGLLKRSNISRDLGNQEAFFGVADSRWFLKQAGKEEAVKLVASAKGGTAVV